MPLKDIQEVDYSDKFQGDSYKLTGNDLSYPKFLQVDKRIAEVTSEIEYMSKLLESKKNYLKQLNACRKMVTPADEAKIQALIAAGLL